MDSFEEKLFSLIEKSNADQQRIQELEQTISVLQKEKAELTKEKTHLNNEITKQQNQLSRLEKMANNLPKEFIKPTNIPKIVNNKRKDAATTAELKQQLTVYIEELDRCIAYLSDLS